MLKEGAIIRFQEAELRPYFFKSQADAISMHPHQLDIYRPDQREISNCFAGWISETPLIRSGLIDTEWKVKQFEALAREVHRQWQHIKGAQFPFRLCVDQLQSVEFEWEKIHQQHQAFIQVSESFDGVLVHQCASIDPLFAKEPPPFKVKSTLDILDQLPKILNMEGWVDFFCWYSELLTRAFSRFPSNSADAYALERHLKEFQHEVESPFLKRARRHLLMMQLAMGSLDRPLQTSYQDRLNKEKEVIKLRYELQKLVRDHYLSLVEMIRLIPLIEEAHPELSTIHSAGVYLRELIAPEVNEVKAIPLSWGRGQMLKQLLCSDLHVIAGINSETGLDRTHLAFALRAAIMEMKEKISPQELEGLVVDWEERTVLLNRLASKQGETGVASVSDRSIQHVCEFRELVYAHLKHCCTVITQWNKEGKATVLSQKLYVNLEPLNFLPAYREGKQLIEYDFKTGLPSGLTKAGLQFFETFVYS
jgi:hypothetical protein